MRLWRDHSLTIVLAIVGSIMLLAACWELETGTKAWDVVAGLAIGVLTVALFYGAANFLRERAKPED